MNKQPELFVSPHSQRSAGNTLTRSANLLSKRSELKEKGSSFDNLNATRIIATTIGVFFGIFSGVNHGIFEILQGNTPTPGLVIQANGEGQRF